MFKIPYFRPPHIEYSAIEPHIREIIISRKYTKGHFRDMLEYGLQEYLGVDHAVACASGTAALWIAARVLRQTTRDKYISVPAFNWGSDKTAMEAAGYKISWNDMETDTWLQRPINNNFTDIMALDTFGNVDTYDECPADATIYDATHSLGAKGVGSRGVAEAFSLAATKPVTAGEGGVITTNDQHIAQKCSELRDQCARIPETSCVIALEYLQHLDENMETKRDINTYYRKHLPHKFQEIPHDSTYSKICFLCDNSEELIERAAKKGVECRKYYKPLFDLPNSRDVFSRIVALPAWVGVNAKQVVEAVARGGC